MNYKRVLFLSVGMLVVFGMFSFVMATNEPSGVNIVTGIKRINYSLFKVGLVSCGLVMFATIFWAYIEGYFSKSLSTKWMVIISAAIFLAVLSQAPKLYSFLIGGEGKDTDIIDKGSAVDIFGGGAE